ncbi:MAG: hypothetical protein HY302_06755 [Opitutae bacterium]|nr:hypothetical protein [Opitutae bacterium]
MKTHRLLFPFVLLAAALSLAPTARAEGRVSVEGILLTASDAKGPTDGRLAPYAPTLRRILRFESYRFVGDGAATMAVPGDGAASLGDGHELEISAERSDGRTVHAKVRWVAGGRTLMSTGLVLRPGVPAVLGGPSTGKKGEVFAVIVIVR